MQNEAMLSDAGWVAGERRVFKALRHEMAVRLLIPYVREIDVERAAFEAYLSRRRQELRQWNRWA